MKYALVTGASRGIGANITLTLLADNYFVFVISQNINNLEKFTENNQRYKNNFLTINTDVSNINQVKKAFEIIKEKTSQLDILVNCAGVSKLNLLDNQSEEDTWHNQININLTGTYYFSKNAYLMMKENNFGRIINISSVYGLIGGEGYSAYCASKHGVIGLTKAMALESAKYNITVNAICPGWVETDMFDNDMQELSDEYGIDKNDLIQDEKISVPTKNFTTVKEISDLVKYLITDSAKNITGQAINISGGLAI